MINTEVYPWPTFFAISTIGDLKKLRAELDCSHPEQRAFSRFIDSWDAMLSSDDNATFDPSAYVSDDLSAALYHSSPCVFMGSNMWSLAPECDQQAIDQYMSVLANRICEIRKANPEAVMVVTVVPEKDYTIDRMFHPNGHSGKLTESMDVLRAILDTHDIHLVFDSYIESLSEYQNIEAYNYPDSHLPTANYVQIMSVQLAKAGISWEEVKSRLSISPQHEYCDLVEKLRLGVSNPTDFSLPNMSGPELELIGGTESFANPLGDTTQIFSNADPLDKRNLLILGDSHSSIYSRKKLTYLNAHVFAQTTFKWNPCGFREEVGAVPEPVIFMEIAQRFMFNPTVALAT